MQLRYRAWCLLTLTRFGRHASCFWKAAFGVGCRGARGGGCDKREGFIAAVKDRDEVTAYWSITSWRFRRRHFGLLMIAGE